MAHSHEASSSLYIEIQILKQALDVSQKKVDRYAHLIATLFDELDSLRNNIFCHGCKIKLVHCTNIATPSVGVAFTAPSGSWNTSVSPFSTQSLPVPVWAVPPPAAPPNLSTAHTTIGLTPTSSNEKATKSRKQKSLLPEWSVVYNPEVKQALDFRVAHFFAYETSVYCVKISSDGQKAAIGVAHNGKTYINEVKKGTNIRVLMDGYIKQGLSIYCVQFSPDGRRLATAASDSRIRLWNVAKGRMQAMFKGHTSRINSMAFSPDGRSIVSSSNDFSVLIWNLRDGSSRKLTEGRTSNLSIGFSPDGKHMAAGNFDSSLRIWDWGTGKPAGQWRAHTNAVWCAEFTPDGKRLMSGSKDKTLRCWDVSLLGVKVNSEEGIPEIRCFEGHTDAIRWIGFLPGENDWVVTCSDDRSVRVWDMETGAWQLSLQGHSGCVRMVDISRTEKMLASVSKDHYVAFWTYEEL